ncbi:MAG TPA: VOC family protein [Opitutaceae bacterium]|nr:VOC family protein [Opitutaceae bacterium]
MSAQAPKSKVAAAKSAATAKPAAAGSARPPALPSQIQSYLFFEGHCEEALAYYRRVLGAEVTTLLRFKDSPEPPEPGMLPPDSGDKVMHAEFRVGGAVVLASDGHCGGVPNFQGFALTLLVRTVAEAEKYFSGLAGGGEVRMPLVKTFFSERFGMVADRFGVLWMVHVAPAGP